MTDPMITAANRIPEGSITIVKDDPPTTVADLVTPRYLDDEDVSKCDPLGKLIGDDQDLYCCDPRPKVSDLLEALETLRTHLRKKYYGG